MPPVASQLWPSHINMLLACEVVRPRPVASVSLPGFCVKASIGEPLVTQSE